MAMCLFLLATLGCLYSRTIMQFVGWRVVQGIVVIDRKRMIRHIEYVQDVSNEPDYEAALRIVETL